MSFFLPFWTIRSVMTRQKEEGSGKYREQLTFSCVLGHQLEDEAWFRLSVSMRPCNSLEVRRLEIKLRMQCNHGSYLKIL